MLEVLEVLLWRSLILLCLISKVCPGQDRNRQGEFPWPGISYTTVNQC